MGGVEKRGGWKTSRLTPLPKRGFGPPSYGTFSTPLRCQCSVFPVQKSPTEQPRSSFGGVQKFSGERVLWYVSPPPPSYVLHPPHITAQCAEATCTMFLTECMVTFSNTNFVPQPIASWTMSVSSAAAANAKQLRDAAMDTISRSLRNLSRRAMLPMCVSAPYGPTSRSPPYRALS